MKKIRVLCCVSALLLTACGARKMPDTKISKQDDITLLEATDLHYLSPSLTDNGTQFQMTMKAGDGKMTEYSTEILDELIDHCLDEKPSALVLTGDLTFNGEKKSLEEIAEKLKKVEDAGIPVIAIPGNHDIDYPFAYRYEGENVAPVEQITTEDFEKIMGDYGWSEAISHAPDSASYTYPLADDTMILALDANTKDHGGGITDETMNWMEQQLQWAQKQNLHTIAISHQNILKQSSLLYEGFVISNGDEVADLLRKYGVKLVLSGHSHLQHTSVENGLTDICTESLAVYPLQYGWVTVPSGRGSFTYENRKLGILEDEAEKRFNTTILRQQDEMFDGLDVDQETKDEMTAFAQKMNRLYFTGHADEIGDVSSDPGWIAWNTYAPDSFFLQYMKSMMENEKN